VEQPQVELIVRLTARVSAAAFAAALILFALGHRHRRRGVRYGVRLFVAFILAHTIHFSAVAWLAMLTAGENIRRRGGWAVVLAVAVLFYLAAFGILRAWRKIGSARLLSRNDRLVTDVGVAFIAFVFRQLLPRTSGEHATLLAAGELYGGDQ
jgi:multisubunit Na+/H+ antiporter MnhB subunit